jgi:flagellar hook-associated protein 2
MTTIGSLDTYFINLINDLMLIERQPVERLKMERSTVDQTRAAFSDADAKLDALQDKVQALISSDVFYDLTAGRSTSVINRPADATIFSATASSGAVPGQYDVSVTRLAKAQREVSAVQDSIDTPLEMTGTFWLGGSGAAAVGGSSASLAGSDTAATAAGSRELGSGDYKVEIRSYEGKLQFRVKNADGEAVAVDDKNASDNSLTSGWQDLAPGETFDTRRGFTFTFSGSPAPGETTLQYTAAGIGVAIAAEDTLIRIAQKLNAAAQPEGRELAASVVGKQLVLTAAHTGTRHTMLFSTDGLAKLGSFTNVQAAQDAFFNVNGIDFGDRQSNTNLTDVIHGITLDLADDAEGKSASLLVKEDYSEAMEAVEAFVDQFNEVIGYLALKTGVEKVGDRQYQRGILADETIFSDLRVDLIDTFSRNTSASGLYKNLRALGLEIGEDLKASFIDKSKFETALKTQRGEVVSLLDQVMRNLDAKLARFTGDSGFLDGALDTYASRLNDIDAEIKDLDARLLERQQYYVDQYSQLQAQLLSMTYAQQMWAGIYGSVNRSM